MTASDSILEALTKANQPAFPWPLLCVLVHRHDPERFGMRGYDHLPDTKRIGSEVANMRRKGLLRIVQAGIRAGYGQVSSQAVWAMTDKGLFIAKVDMQARSELARIRAK